MGIDCDLQYVFDTVSHSILLSLYYIIMEYEVRAYNWFKNYLTNRKQYVAIDNVSSTMCNIDCGVPCTPTECSRTSLVLDLYGRYPIL